MKKKLFIINTITDWNEPPRARHQIAYALSKNNYVVFVSSNRIGSPKYKIIQESDTLEVFIPYFPINYKIRYRIPLLNNLYQNWLYKRLQKLYTDAIIISFDFTAVHINQFFSNRIYYCNDDFIGMSYKFNPKWIARYHERCEKKLAQQADFCVGTSEYLTARLKKYNENSFEIRLGAPEIKDFNINRTIPAKDIKPIHVGIVGFIESIDSHTLNFLASKDDLFITLVGPVTKKDQEKLSKKKNIRITGSLTGKRLYEQVSMFHVGLIPYKFHSSIDRTPNKLWLYLSLGVPIVISNIEGIKNWQFPDKFVYRANNSKEFYDLIRLAYLEDHQSLIKNRKDLAAQNTWEVRMKQFLKIVDSFAEN